VASPVEHFPRPFWRRSRPLPARDADVATADVATLDMPASPDYRFFLTKLEFRGKNQLSYPSVADMNTEADLGFFRFGERPLGSEANRRAAEYLGQTAEQMGFSVRRLPFITLFWEKGPSVAERGGARVDVLAGPYSPAFDARAEMVSVTTAEELRAAEPEGRILLMHGELAREPLFPRDFPFYFPDEHKAVYEILDAKRPAAILAATGRHPSCGLNPFPLFDDETFQTPAAYMDATSAARLLKTDGPIRLKIDSRTMEATGERALGQRLTLGVDGVNACT
ncbi:MAG: hypothetical protein U1E05_13065, partial [Patescibacteria group bacterium]|nr:hypothetical protein [Patescibacteria group bacterium]